jgi:hypothetical protein
MAKRAKQPSAEAVDLTTGTLTTPQLPDITQRNVPK